MFRVSGDGEGLELTVSSRASTALDYAGGLLVWGSLYPL